MINISISGFNVAAVQFQISTVTKTSFSFLNHIIQFRALPFRTHEIKIKTNSSFCSAHPAGFCVTTLIFAECQQDMCLRAPSKSSKSLTGGGSSTEPNSSTSNKALPGGRGGGTVGDSPSLFWHDFPSGHHRRSVKVACFSSDTISFFFKVPRGDSDNQDLSKLSLEAGSDSTSAAQGC